MSNEMQDFQSFLDDDSLTTPKIKSKKYPEGKVYVIESPDAETGLRLNAMANLAAKAATGGTVDENDIKGLKMNDDEERTFMKQVLGDVYDELIEDGVSWVKIQRLNQYAFAYFAVSPQAANRGVSQGIFAGKAQDPTQNRAARRAKPKKDSSEAKSARPASGGSKKPKQPKG